MNTTTAFGIEVKALHGGKLGEWRRVRFQPRAWGSEVMTVSDRDEAAFGASLFASSGTYAARIIEVRS